MDANTRRVVGFVTAQLVFIAALVHLGLGLFQWIEKLVLAGWLVPRDARWPVFVFSGLAVLVGMYAAARAGNRRPYYAAGIVVMLGYVVAYFGWHLGGHRLLLVAGPGAGNESISVGWFLDHLFAGPVEFLAIVTETLAALGLAVLFVTEDGDASAVDGIEGGGE